MTSFSANSWNDLNSMYNEQFTLSSAIWTKYIFESFDLSDGQDHIECGVKCEISDTTCNFFLVASDKCHLGRYDHYGSGTVTDSNVPLTYHKQSKRNLITITFILLYTVFSTLLLKVLLNHTLQQENSGGIVTLMIGQIGFTNMKPEPTQGSAALNAFMMILVISLLTFIVTVCMEDGLILEQRSFLGLMMSQFTTRLV